MLCFQNFSFFPTPFNIHPLLWMGFKNFEKDVVADKILDFFDTQLFDTQLFFWPFCQFCIFLPYFPISTSRFFLQMQKDNGRIAQIKKLKKTNQL